MREPRSIRLEHQGICYSGYRAGQSPDTGVYPTAEQVEEDLRILVQRWRYIRLCLLYTSPSPRDGLLSRMPSSA